MRFRIAFAALFIVALAGAIYVSKTRSVVETALQNGAKDFRGSSEVSIVLTEKGFEPDKVLITHGTRVVFTTTRPYLYWPASNPHPSHNLYTGFDPKEPLSASSTWSFVPEKGIWGFHDHIRPYYLGVLYVD